MNYKIRCATLEDAKLANSFLTKLIRDEKQYDKNINDNFIVNEMYENLITNQNNCLLVAEIDNELVGYLYGFIQDNGDSCIEPIAYIDAMFIEEEERCNGIATALIQKFKCWVLDKKVRYIELKVCTNNSNAISLYKKNGFNDLKTIMRVELDK